MSDYIESNKKPIASYLVGPEPWEPNCGCPNPEPESIDTECPLYKTWEDLYNRWDNMTFEEKYALFMPYTFFYDPSDSRRLTKLVIDINDTIVNRSISTGRLVSKVLYQLNRNDIPMYTIIYDPIKISMITHKGLRDKMTSFAVHHKLFQ